MEKEKKIKKYEKHRKKDTHMLTCEVLHDTVCQLSH